MRKILYWCVILCLLIILFGCPQPNKSPSPVKSKCRYDQSNRTLIVIDWNGRKDNAYLTREDALLNVVMPAPGVDLSQFITYRDGMEVGRLSGRVSELRGSVQARLSDIFSNISPYDTIFVTGEAEDYPEATKLYMVQDEYQVGAVGIANQDHGNLRVAEDVAIVLGNELVRGNMKRPSFEGWVNFFSNVAAHEVGHTMGWGHSKTWVCIDPALPCMDENRKGLYGWTPPQEEVEVMRAIRGLMWFMLPHEFRVEQSTSQYAANLEECIPVEYDVVNPHISFPDHPFFTNPNLLVPFDAEIAVCGIPDVPE